MDPNVILMRGAPAVVPMEESMAPRPAVKRAHAVRVVLADGDPITRRRLCDVLQADGDVTVVAQARDGAEAVELAVYCRPDVVLSELRLDQVEGVEVMWRIHRRAPEVRVLFLATERRAAVQLEVIRAGACGVLSKETPPEGVVRALRGVVRGEAATSRAVAHRLVAELREIPQAGSGVRPIQSTLTPREWEVLDALCAGASLAAIADSMDVARATVKSHLKRVMAKLGAHTREETIRLARERFRFREAVM